MWFFIFYRARCVSIEHTPIAFSNLPITYRQDGAKLLVRPIILHCTRWLTFVP